ncbi:MAG: hypothetical protein JSV63_03135 [Candidatus Aenigmatarchaeota archaeon]|nr:MAG: hypothetical protein JSV63_03135 [Candidatus Aenigmarchaeota archaeon]
MYDRNSSPLYIKPSSFVHYDVCDIGDVNRPGLIEADPARIRRLRGDAPRPCVRSVKVYLGENPFSLVYPFVPGRKDVKPFDLRKDPFSQYAEEGTLASVDIDDLEEFSELLHAPPGVVRILRCHERVLRDEFERKCHEAGLNALRKIK